LSEVDYDDDNRSAIASLTTNNILDPWEIQCGADARRQDAAVSTYCKLQPTRQMRRN